MLWICVGALVTCCPPSGLPMWESQTPIVCRAQRHIVCRTHSTQIWGDLACDSSFGSSAGFGNRIFAHALGPVCTTGHSLCEKIGGSKNVKDVKREAGNKIQNTTETCLERTQNISRQDQQGSWNKCETSTERIQKTSRRKKKHMPKPKNQQERRPKKSQEQIQR